MKPFREHGAIAVDDSSIKGVIVTYALAILEEHLGQSSTKFLVGGGHFYDETDWAIEIKASQTP